MREDPSKKVYIWDNSSNSEKLLYDFSLSLGDSLIMTTIWGCPVQSTVDTVDTIVLLNGELRKRYVFSPGVMGTDIWIEGIGSLGGLFGAGGICFTDYGSGLLCFTEDATLKYMHSYFNTCYYPVGVENQPHEESSHIPFPNPTSRFIYLTNFGELSAENVSLYNILGVSMKIPIMDNTRMDLESLADGVYFLELKSEGKSSTRKVIKQSY